MNELSAVQPDKIDFGGRTIRFIGYEPIANSALISAVVVIEPSTTGDSPDRVCGLGNTEIEAKADAFKKAKEQILKNTKRE